MGRLESLFVKMIQTRKPSPVHRAGPAFHSGDQKT